MAKPVPIGVHSSLAICNSLKSLLAKAFGPNALQVLYTTSTGKVLLTSDGSTILSALHISHPVGRWLINRVLKFHTLTGDHAKSYVMLVRDVLDGICHELGGSVDGLNKRSEIVAKDQVIKLRQALLFVLQEIFPSNILPALLEQSVSLRSVDLEAVDTLGLNVVHTHLAGMLTPKQTKLMSKLIWNFITSYAGESSACSLEDAALDIIDNFAVNSLEAVGLPIESSHIEDGIILSRCFVNSSNTRKDDALKQFVLLGFNPSRVAAESKATILARRVEDLVLNMEHTGLQVAKMVNLLVRSEVRVVLCSECLPPMLLSLLQQASIIVVHTLPIEELQRLSSVAKVDILYEMPSSLLDDSFIASAQEVKQIIFGNQRCTRLTLGERTGVTHLVLCAPSEGMCRVLSQAVINAVKCVKLWLESKPAVRQCDADSESPSEEQHLSSFNSFQRLEGATLKDCYCGTVGEQGVTKQDINPAKPKCDEQGRSRELLQCGHLISGGGAAELIASNNLTQLLTAYKGSHYLSLALKIISNALLCIPRAIYQNSFVGGAKDTHSFVTSVAQVKYWHDGKHKEMWGIDGKSGELCCLSERGILEATMGKYSLWCSAIETVYELLNMDMIVPVQKITDAAGSEDEYG